MEPISMGIMGVQAGLGVLQNQQAHVARQQEYKNQTAFQGVQQNFNSWQAGFNANFQTSIANTDIGARLSGTTRSCHTRGSWRTMNLQKRLHKPSGCLKRVLGQVWITSLAPKRSKRRIRSVASRKLSLSSS